MNHPAPPHSPSLLRSRQDFYAKISEGHCTPLWEVLQSLLTVEPSTPVQPHLWTWQQMWPWLLEGGRLISAQEAERRVLVLENPGLRGRTRITHSLYAGLQLILPGETAPSHRHSQSALRFILHGEGAYTAVDGKRVPMNVGDFIITPSWAFHEHGHHGDEPVVWLDALDLPLVELLDAQFREDGARTPHGSLIDAGPVELARFGHTMKPVGYRPATRTSPLFWYPYDRTRQALHTLQSAEAPHACWGHKLQYTNPDNGGWAMPTIGASMQLLPAGFDGRAYRSTDSTVYTVVEGHGRCTIGQHAFSFGPRDVFVCPSWMPYRLHGTDDCVLFSFSDRPVQQALDLWREAF